MQSRAERLSREPLKPVATIGKLLLFAYYTSTIRKSYMARLHRTYCTPLADTVYYAICAQIA